MKKSEATKSKAKLKPFSTCAASLRKAYRPHVAPDGEGYTVASSACKPRGGPKISRMRIASRKLDFDASKLAISLLDPARLATISLAAASDSTAALIIDGCRGPTGNAA